MYKVNISIDDVSPHPRSSIKVLQQCYKLIEEFENIKFTLFVPVAYWRTMGNTATEKPFFIHEIPEFCDAIRELPSKNFEIGYHGYHHGIPGFTNNDEFSKLNFEHADYLFKLMHKMVLAADLQDTFKPIFRPPAWKMSEDAIVASKANNMEILALSPKYDCGGDFEHIIYETCNPPLLPLKFFEKTEIVYHACEWDRNYLDDKKTKQLSDFLKTESVEFCFMEDMV